MLLFGQSAIQACIKALVGNGPRVCLHFVAPQTDRCSAVVVGMTCIEIISRLLCSNWVYEVMVPQMCHDV